MDKENRYTIEELKKILSSDKESDTIINGHILSVGESKILKVSVNYYMYHLINKGLHDESLCNLYIKCCKMILSKMDEIDKKDIIYNNENNKYTIEEIRKYLLSQDSMGDILYYLNDENIRKANETKIEEEDDL